MTPEQTIFGLRFGSNAELAPTQEELDLFLAGEKPGSRNLHGDDLVQYGGMIDRITAFNGQQGQDASARDFRERMFFGVLGHSQFFNPALKLAVEHYKYHRHAHALLDFKKPAAFVKSAEEEMARLNPKKKDDAARLVRLGVMTDERKRTLDATEKHRAALARELVLIAHYIRDNLVGVEKLCEGAIVVLVDLQISQREEKRLIEDLREQFREQLRDSLHHGQVSKQDLETVKRDVEVLSKEIGVLLRDDVYALTGLYEGIHDHVKDIVDGITALLEEAVHGKDRRFEDERELFGRIEEVLVSLVNGYRLELKTTVPHSETQYGRILLEKRREILVRLFELLRKERRTLSDRRTGEDRRRSGDSDYRGPDRRTGADRRSAQNRRK